VDTENDDRSSLRFLLQRVELGAAVSGGLQGATGGADVVDNASVNVLCRLDLEGTLRPMERVGSTGLTSGGLTKVVTRLESAGFVSRERDTVQRDKRAVSVVLTEEGHELMAGFARELRVRISDARLLVKSLSRLAEQ